MVCEQYFNKSCYLKQKHNKMKTKRPEQHKQQRDIVLLEEGRLPLSY